MSKRILVLLMCLCLCLVVGCSKEPERLSVDVGDDISVPETPIVKEEFSVNPLTGVKDLEIGKEKDRPVAVTINNISVAQPVQTGLGKADIVYETEVEGGITRLLALFQDVSKVKKLGTIRSARYVFIDLAMGHNAVYAHHGQDSYHAGPHLNDLDHFVIDENNAGVRISNNLSREHTLYAYGDKLWECIENKFDTENTSQKPWVNFAAEEANITFDNKATSVKVPFSQSYTSSFKYNEESGKYIRYFNGTERKDYNTGENEQFTNVFVLLTDIYTYPNCNDGYKHKKVDLKSGNGYYFANGTYTMISWSKGNSSSGFVFKSVDGTQLSVQPGNSWVCIANQQTVFPVIE